MLDLTKLSEEEIIELMNDSLILMKMGEDLGEFERFMGYVEGEVRDAEFRGLVDRM